jgi:hypothetical protein
VAAAVEDDVLVDLVRQQQDVAAAQDLAERAHVVPPDSIAPGRVVAAC